MIGTKREIKYKMHSHYFEYKGRTYYAGTKVKIKAKSMYHTDKIFAGEFRGYSDKLDKPFLFAYYDDSPRGVGVPPCLHVCKWSKEEVEDKIVEIISGNYYTELEQRKRYIPDSKILELVIGWFLYIFIMVGSSIFNGRVGGWIVLTILFFVWRHKIKEDNVYYE